MEGGAFSGDRFEVGPSADGGVRSASLEAEETKDEGRSLRLGEGRWKSKRTEVRARKGETEGRGTKVKPEDRGLRSDIRGQRSEV